jgi:cobalt-zinc-cadmium efflux system outer membrane protein
MNVSIRICALMVTATLLGACASVPKDSGFGDVRQAVLTETQAPVEWNRGRPVEPPDDAAVSSLLEEELTPERAVRIAFAHNRDLQATLEELGVARADLIAASTVRNPVAEGELRFPGDPVKPFEISIHKTIIDLFQLGNRKRMGRAQFEVAKLRVGGAVINFGAEVRRHYYDLLAARKVLARTETILRAQEASAELARRQHAAGNISDLDLESEQSRYEQVKLDHARAQLDEIQSRERVVADLGLARRADLRLPDEFPAPPVEESAGQVEQEVLTRRLDIRMAEREVEAARRAASLAKTAAFEDLDVGVHHEREPDGKRSTGPDITVPIPIFDRGTAQKTRARALLRQAQQRLNALRVTALSEARSAHERLGEARARREYLRDVVVPRRQRILQLSQLEYNAMLRGVFQLLEARRNLSEAQREEIMATRDYWIARTDLETALLGVGRFSVRPEPAEAERLELFAPMTQQESQSNE